MEAELGSGRVRLEALPFVRVPPLEGDAEKPLPEAPCPLEVVGR